VVGASTLNANLSAGGGARWLPRRANRAGL